MAMCWLSLVVITVVIEGLAASDDENRLVSKLMEKYNPNVRPVMNASHALRVSLDVALNQIVNMDQKYQILVSMVWLRMYWVDDHLVWEPKDYGNITSIRLKTQNVWIPDITLYNDAGDKGMKNILFYNVKYTSDGNASWLAPILFTSSCKLELAAFPYDLQKCNLTLASWTFHGYDLDLWNEREDGDLAEFNSNGEWEVESMPVTRTVKYYNCCKEPYPSLTYTIRMRRMPLFYTFNLLVPCVVITAITAVGFYLPPDSGEKCSLMITIMLSLTVFLLMVAESMPPSSVAIPLIGWYFAASIILVAISTTLTVVIIATHHKGNHNKIVPPWIRKLVLCYLATLIGRRKMVKEMACTSMYKGSKTQGSFSVTPTLEDKAAESIVMNSINLEQPAVTGLLRMPVKSTNSKTNQLLSRIATHTQYLCDIAESKDTASKVSEEWQMVAIILDRFCFYLFGIVVITFGVFMFTYSP